MPSCQQIQSPPIYLVKSNKCMPNVEPNILCCKVGVYVTQIKITSRNMDERILGRRLASHKPFVVFISVWHLRPPPSQR